jgi:hypothetical protein
VMGGEPGMKSVSREKADSEEATSHVEWLKR